MRAVSFALTSLLLGLLAVPSARGVVASVPRGGVYLLPMTCAELLPDNGPYLGFLESVGQGSVGTDSDLSKRIFRLLALRAKFLDARDVAPENNPVDILIRRTLCFFREQKDPLRTIPYDDGAFLRFFRTSLRELELKIDGAIFQVEVERAQRHAYESQLQRNRTVVERMRREADAVAETEYDRLTKSAKRKVGSP